MYSSFFGPSRILSTVLLSIGRIAILFYLIKSAVQTGIRKTFREQNSGTDFEFKQSYWQKSPK